MTFNNIKGWPELQKALDEFPQKLLKSTMRKALYAGAKVIALEARQLCPVAEPSNVASVKYGAKTGTLKKSIRYGSTVDKSRMVVVGYVKAGPRNDQDLAPYYGLWVEYGTAAHFIRHRKTTKALSFPAGGFASQVSHPGATPRPFMRPALDSKALEAIEAVRAVVAQAVAKRQGPSE